VLLAEVLYTAQKSHIPRSMQEQSLPGLQPKASPSKAAAP
jgi:hypothetical protein